MGPVTFKSSQGDVANVDEAVKLVKTSLLSENQIEASAGLSLEQFGKLEV